MTINIDYCKYLKNKVKKVDYIIGKLYNIIMEPEELEYSRSDTLKLAELYSTIDVIEGLCITDDQFHRFIEDYVVHVRLFYYNLADIITGKENNISWITEEYNMYSKVYNETYKLLDSIK
ncbi:MULTISPECIES: hypothetical protein [Staphylococcus]|uniref:hypothetical protein n=1 Tax=Staphylococcus TaxID=1279 RepID=UPI001C1F1D63|nr:MULTISPECIES: hypothetical protein [Staphylococcus]MBU6943315.1 hypothetical protein [Staphylococcus sp. CWZ226]UXR47184.1 hypothetical protein MUA57_10160 [Staphylococcus simulans]